MSWPIGTIVVRVWPSDSSYVLSGEMIQGSYYTVRGSGKGFNTNWEPAVGIFVNEVICDRTARGSEWAWDAKGFRIAETTINEIVMESQRKTL